LIIALGIAFVDALPILGSGTVMVPWGIISALNGNLRLGIAIIVLWIIMSVVRQFIEPKIVSRKYWNTPNIYNNSNVYRL
jgi:predicted PurR-regulated permease PerM